MTKTLTEMRERAEEPKEKDHYWICDACAKAKGWKPCGYAVTMIHDECPYCGNTAMLSCAHTDWIKNGKGPLTWD